jgi:hypothetical protein
MHASHILFYIYFRHYSILTKKEKLSRENPQKGRKSLFYEKKRDNFSARLIFWTADGTAFQPARFAGRRFE